MFLSTINEDRYIFFRSLATIWKEDSFNRSLYTPEFQPAYVILVKFIWNVFSWRHGKAVPSQPPNARSSFFHSWPLVLRFLSWQSIGMHVASKHHPFTRRPFVSQTIGKFLKDSAMPRKAKLPLEGLAQKWEQSDSVRSRLRNNEVLLLTTGQATFRPTVQSVSLHVDLLAPVLEMTKGILG